MGAISKLSVMQLPKDAKFLECFEANPGCSLIYIDFNSIEPHALAEFSRDPRLLSVYGPDAIPFNDIYLYWGTETTQFSSIVRQFFDPAQPTEAMLAEAKKRLKLERALIKEAYLALQYGLGWKQLQVMLNLAGYACTVKQARDIFSDYWRFFVGVRHFDAKLQQMYERNAGYIINGRGRPMPVAHDQKHNMVNRFVQSTAHDILLFFLLLINRARVARKVPMRPYLVDEHDATIWEAPTEHALAAKAILEDSLVELNSILGWSVKFKGQVSIGTNLSIKLGD